MPLYFDDIYTSRIKDTFIRIMSTKVSCINCGVTSSVIQNIKRYIFHYTTPLRKQFLLNLLYCNFAIHVIIMYSIIVEISLFPTQIY